MTDNINHPKHYCSHPANLECIQVTERLGFCAGNAVKYLWRADFKGKKSEDIKKAIWYIDRIVAANDCASYLVGFNDATLERYEDRLAKAGGWNAPMICNLLRGIRTNSISHIMAARNQLDYLLLHPTAERAPVHQPLNA